MKNSVKLQAHKGVETEYPENTLPAFIAAGEQGYEMIELDLRMTKDNRIIVMHDSIINSTGRNPDGSEIKEKTYIYDITYEEALEYDFGIWFSEKFKGTKLPLFDDVLPIAKKYGITLKIDNKIKRFTPEQLDILFEMINASGVKTIISCWDSQIADTVMKSLHGADISFDGLTDENELRHYSSLAGKDRFWVWIPIDYEMATWAPTEWFASDEQCRIIKKYARLGIWAIKDENSFLDAAERLMPDAAETSGNLKPDSIG